jgi:hypothetical protein
MHAVIARTHLSILRQGYAVQLLLLRFWSLRKQAAGQRVVVLTKGSAQRSKSPDWNDDVQVCLTSFPYSEQPNQAFCLNVKRSRLNLI